MLPSFPPKRVVTKLVYTINVLFTQTSLTLSPTCPIILGIIPDGIPLIGCQTYFYRLIEQAPS